MTTIELAVFDMAGTTLEEHGDVYRALRQSVEETGTEVTEENLQTWMGTDKVEAIRNLLRLGGHKGDEATVAACFDRFRALLGEFYAATPPEPLPGVPEALAALRANGIKVALTTGFSTDVAGPLLKGLGWATGEDGNLDAVVCSDEVAAGRPYPYMIQRAMERTGTKDVRTVLVAGDTVVDVEAGSAAGAGVVLGVETGKLTADDFSALDGAKSLPSVAEIPAFLGLRA
ncbi:phosphonatase-like hydrolase [Brevibacterium metallidurans]|uniref:Phosphonatase-like hydrolase n=1 Tax=Brevibacterium metallidurans TaxID=1482676 RepID=A0ABN0SLJ0_9MICO